MKLIFLLFFVFISTSTLTYCGIPLSKLTIKMIQNKKEISITMPPCELNKQSLKANLSPKLIFQFKQPLNTTQSKIIANSFDNIQNTNHYGLPFIYISHIINSKNKKGIFHKEALKLELITEQIIEMKFPLGKGKKTKETLVNSIKTYTGFIKAYLGNLEKEVVSQFLKYQKLLLQIKFAKRGEYTEESQKRIAINHQESSLKAELGRNINKAIFDMNKLSDNLDKKLDVIYMKNQKLKNNNKIYRNVLQKGKEINKLNKGNLQTQIEIDHLKIKNLFPEIQKCFHSKLNERIEKWLINEQNYDAVIDKLIYYISLLNK